MSPHVLGLGITLLAPLIGYTLYRTPVGLAALPYQWYLMLPYGLSIVALVLIACKASYPHTLMKPYRKGER